MAVLDGEYLIGKVVEVNFLHLEFYYYQILTLKFQFIYNQMIYKQLCLVMVKKNGTLQYIKKQI
jgi:hypothetical protein